MKANVVAGNGYSVRINRIPCNRKPLGERYNTYATRSILTRNCDTVPLRSCALTTYAI